MLPSSDARIPSPNEQHERLSTESRRQWLSSSADPSLSRPLDIFSREIEMSRGPTIYSSLQALALYSWLNVFLIFVPVAIIIRHTSKDPRLLFAFSTLALIPVSKVLGIATTELSYHVGGIPAKFMRAFTGNTVEIVFSIVCLAKCELIAQQSAFVGSILINLLLGIGALCIGTGKNDAEFDASEGQVLIHVLTMLATAILFPSTFAAFVDDSTIEELAAGRLSILDASRISSFIMLLLYLIYVTKKFHSYIRLDGWHRITSPSYPFVQNLPWLHHRNSGSVETHTSDSNSLPGQPMHDVESHTECSSASDCKLSIWIIPVVGGVSFFLIGVLCMYFVSSLSTVASNSSMTTQWAGLILVPLIGTLARHDPFQAMVYGYKGRTNESITLNLDASTNMALFVQPMITLIAWPWHKNLTFLFDPFQILVLFLCVNTVDFTLVHTRCNRGLGFILGCLYCLLVTIFWFYPGNNIFEDLLWSC